MLLLLNAAEAVEPPPAPATGGGGAGRPFGYASLLRRVRQERSKPLRSPKSRYARKRVRGIEIQAARAVLAGSGEDKFRELMAQWVAQKPALPDQPGLDVPQLFLAQVAMRLRQIEQDEEEALIALLLH